LEIVFLGTGGAMPTRDRSLPSIVVRRESEIFMFDCGECSQRQMAAAKLGFNRKMKILISHMHGDHVFGLPGLLQSMSFLGRQKKLDIYGPEGIADFVDAMNRTVRFNQRFPTEIHEVQSGTIIDEDEYTIEAAKLEHGALCLGFALIEKNKPGRFDPTKARALGVPEGPLWKKLQSGKAAAGPRGVIKPSQIMGPPRRGLKIAYITDTRPCNASIEISRKATVLMHDCTFDSTRSEQAKEYGHSTAEEAATLARDADVDKLVLIHISAIYEDASPLLEEAKTIFQNTTLASDLMKLKVR